MDSIEKNFDGFSLTLAFTGIFLLGSVVGYSICDESPPNFYKKFWIWFTTLERQKASGFLSASAGVLGAFVGVSIPLSLNIVSNNLNKYKDVWISEMFRKEYPYKYQFKIVIPSITYILILTCFKSVHPVFLFIGLVLMVVSIFLFYKFLRLMEKYSTQSDEIILETAKKQIDEILEK
jgi:predicted membrane-bound spermidine synthase